VTGGAVPEELPTNCVADRRRLVHYVCQEGAVFPQVSKPYRDHTLGMSQSRDERRRKARADARRRQEELEKVLEQPRPRPFEAPPSATVVENPERPKR
jgi:hypothetical protein